MIRRLFPGSFRLVRGAWASPSRRAIKAESQKKPGPREYALFFFEVGVRSFMINLLFDDPLGSTWRRLRGKDIEYACRDESRYLIKCLSQSGNHFSDCQHYLDSMQSCRKRAAAKRAPQND